VRANIQPQRGRNARKAGVMVSEIAAADTKSSPEPDHNGHDGPLLDPAQERARRDAAMAIRLEMENELRAGELCEISTITAVIERDYGTTKNRLMNIPAKTAVALSKATTPAECFEIMDAAIRAAMDELCADEAFAEIERQARAATAGG
jgi:hypothetical protein